MVQKYPWYDIVKTRELEQGDLLTRCPVLKTVWSKETFTQTETEYELQAQEEIFDVVVMSQSCDLVNDKVDSVLVCPYHDIDIFIQDAYPTANAKSIRTFREKVRRGDMPGYHMVAACEFPTHEQNIQIVSFYDVFSIPKEFASDLVENRSPRLRLMPPYREHLGQAFARFFMRVGLPIDIPNQR